MDDEGVIVVSDPWWDLRVRGSDEAAARVRLVEELRRELNPGHVLAGEPVDVIAACQHCDNVLVRAGTGWAIVHLTYAPDERPPWPHTDVFATAPEAHAAAAYHASNA